MIPKLKKIINERKLLKVFALSLLVFPLFYSQSSQKVKAGLEFQWEDNGHKRLKWYQRTSLKRAQNKIFFFLRPSDRNTGLLKINIKVPDNFSSKLVEDKISLCKVTIGGFNSRTKCIENIPSDIEINDKKTKIDIYPINPLPSSKDSYAVVFKVNNPRRNGLYQFHSFGQSAGKIPVSYYLGTWTLKIDQS